MANPSAQRKQDKISKAVSARNTFGAIAAEVIGNKEANREIIMTIRIVIIAACAGTLALLAQADVARAQSTAVNTSHSNIRHLGEVKSGTNTGAALPKAQRQKAGPGEAMPNIADQAAGAVLSKKKN